MSGKINYLDCNQSQMGTGVLSCEVRTGVPYGFFRTAPGWRFDPETETFDDAYIEEQIRKRKLVPFLRAIGFEVPEEGGQTFTSNLGVKMKVLDGLPEFSFDYSNGAGFHRAAYSYNSFGGYGTLLAYNNGVVRGSLDGSGKVKGLETGMFDTGNYKEANGSDPQKTTITLQLTDPMEYNMRYALLDGGANGFSLATVAGIIDVDIDPFDVGDPQGFLVRFSALNNKGRIIKGLTTKEIQVYVQDRGIITCDVIYLDPEGYYSIEFPDPVEGLVTISLFDIVKNLDVIKLEESLYQGRVTFKT